MANWGHDQLTGTVLDVEDSVLLEDRAEHGLDDNAGSGVGDEGALLMEGLGEEIDTKVSVLAGGSRGGDADHLAGTALEHEEVANADVVAGNGDSVGHQRSTLLPGSTGSTGYANLTLLLDMVVVVAGLWVHNLISQLVQARAERVVVT